MQSQSIGLGVRNSFCFAVSYLILMAFNSSILCSYSSLSSAHTCSILFLSFVFWCLFEQNIESVTVNVCVSVCLSVCVKSNLSAPLSLCEWKPFSYPALPIGLTLGAWPFHLCFKYFPPFFFWAEFFLKFFFSYPFSVLSTWSGEMRQYGWRVG